MIKHKQTLARRCLRFLQRTTVAADQLRLILPGSGKSLLPDYPPDAARPVIRSAVPGNRERGSPASFRLAAGAAARSLTTADDLPYGTACHA